MINLSRLIVGPGCFFLGTKNSEVDSFTFHRNKRNPLLSSFVPTNTLKSRGVSSAYPMVVVVLLFGALAQVFFSIVECVVRTVVHLFIMATQNDFAVHTNRFLSSSIDSLTGTTCVKTLSMGIPFSKPFMRRKFSEVFGINDCVLPLCKRDKHRASILAQGAC